jgi:hypothetical protein
MSNHYLDELLPWPCVLAADLRKGPKFKGNGDILPPYLAPITRGPFRGKGDVRRSLVGEESV